MKKISHCFKQWANIIYPNYCLWCQTKNTLNQSTCEYCHKLLPWNRHPCLHCALPLNNAQYHHCGQCTATFKGITQVIAPFCYQSPIKEAIIQFKFRRELRYGHALGELLSKALLSTHLQAGKPGLIIPVPLHKKRLRQRGYNQALQITKIIAKQLKIDYSTQLCYRRLNTTAQSTLSSQQRSKNIRGAFTIDARRQPVPKHIAIVDDIVTTGHTVKAISQLLKQFGAKTIVVWCLARAFLK